jgi:aspartate carbamoyltransferase regulatory subunit
MSSPKKLMSKKKPTFPVNEMLDGYLKRYKRNIKIPIFYDDLLRFQGSVAVFDKNDEDTLWVRTYYSEWDREEIDKSLKKIYTMLHSDGSNETIPFLNIDAIDYCTFGNSKPFRIKVRNILNDNFIYFYVKKADASRIYGLELEHILSPHNMNFLVHKETLIEEHIAGIPGDDFIRDFLPKCSESEKSQIAKEFVKFKERCLIRLLGDMRSYNYVITPTHDFDQIVYKFRAIDFDQQSFEGNLKVYNLQFMKENFKMIEMVGRKLQNSSINQYKVEERSFMAKRMITSPKRTSRLIKCMKKDTISFPENIELLKKHLIQYVGDVKFKDCKNMGEILETILDFVKRNYLNISNKELF